MSISAFDTLTEGEKEIMLQVPVWVSALIAAADLDVDARETDLAGKVIKYRKFSSDPTLHTYYEQASESFEDALNSLIESFGGDTANMVESLHKKIADVNPILGKIDSSYKTALVASWRSLAKRVAEATGGLLGFGSIDAAEKELISLPMIQA